MRPRIEEVAIRSNAHDMLPRLRYEGPHKKGIDVASYYGFHLLEAPKIKRDDCLTAHTTLCAPECVALLRSYFENGMDTWEQPVHLAHTIHALPNAYPEIRLEHRNPDRAASELRLDIIGSRESLAEASLIRTTHAILAEHDITDTVLHINSLGGADSVERFAEEAASYFKKHLGALDPDTREAFKTDPLAPFRSEHQLARHVSTDAPTPLSFLGDASREHLKSVLEYLESFDIPYIINERLVGGYQYGLHIIFEFRSEHGDVYAVGERYDRLAKRAGFGRAVPAVGVRIFARRSRTDERITPYKKNIDREPKVFFIQLGFDAKRAALRILEDLRKSGVPVRTSLHETSFVRQLALAEASGALFLFIIGQKEITEGTAIVRHRLTHAERILPLAASIQYLQRTIHTTR